MDEIITDVSDYYLETFTEEFLKREFIKPYPFIKSLKPIKFQEYEQ